MLTWCKNFRERRCQQKIILGLLQEITSNLESCYVAEQLGQFKYFATGVWERMNSARAGSWPPEILVYAKRIAAFNAALDEADAFERWYSANLDRQTLDNARILHARKEAVQERFSGLTKVVGDAKTAIQQLIN